MLVGSHLVGGSIAILGSIVLTIWHYRKRIPQWRWDLKIDNMNEWKKERIENEVICKVVIYSLLWFVFSSFKSIH